MKLASGFDMGCSYHPFLINIYTLRLILKGVTFFSIDKTLSIMDAMSCSVILCLITKKIVSFVERK